MRRLIALLICLLAPAVLRVQAAELHVAVAANFFGPLQKLAPMFEQASGNQLLISSGSSGQLYTQIKQGAPFDVFLSADSEKPQLLENEGLAIAGSRFTYAVGALVLWSAKPGLVDNSGKVLQAQQYRFIGVANPQTAPYGTAAQQVLTKLGLWDKLNRERKIVIGENITQAWRPAMWIWRSWRCPKSSAPMATSPAHPGWYRNRCTIASIRRPSRSRARIKRRRPKRS